MIVDQDEYVKQVNSVSFNITTQSGKIVTLIYRFEHTDPDDRDVSVSIDKEAREFAVSLRYGNCDLTINDDPMQKTVTSLFSFYDQEDVYDDCTVQILTNSHTGDVSTGWWRNGYESDP